MYAEFSIYRMRVHCVAEIDVRFTPKSGHVQCTRSCLLWAKSGHLVER
jgi:hypothetical protein